MLRHSAFWALVGALLATAFALITYPSIPPASDLWDYAQEARQLARGEGFTSLYTYPVHLGSDDPPFPVRWRMPLFAALGAGLMSVGVPLPAGFFVLGVIAHAVLAALVFLLASHLHSERAGAIAAAAAVASPLLLDPYSAALSQVPAAALALGVWLLLLRGSGFVSAWAAAILAAAAWYLRGEAMLMVPVWLWAAVRGGRSGSDAMSREAAPSTRARDARPWIRSVLFGVAYAGLCVPWVIALRAMSGATAPIQGNPMLLYTEEYPGYSSSRTYGEPLPGVLEYLLTHPIPFAWRFLKDIAGYAVDLMWGIGPVALGLALAGLLLREPRERWRSLLPAVPLLAGAAIQIAAFSCLERSPRFLVPAVPLIAVGLGIAAAPSLDRICGKRNVIVLFGLLLMERGITLAFETREAARRFPPLPAVMAQDLARALAPDGARSGARDRLVWTDVPDWVAWHLDRPALLLPRWGQIEQVARDHPVEAIFLSPHARARNAADGEEEWVRAIDRNEPVPGFTPPSLLAGGARVDRAAR